MARKAREDTSSRAASGSTWPLGCPLSRRCCPSQVTLMVVGPAPGLRQISSSPPSLSDGVSAADYVTAGPSYGPPVTPILSTEASHQHRMPCRSMLSLQDVRIRRETQPVGRRLRPKQAACCVNLKLLPLRKPAAPSQTTNSTEQYLASIRTAPCESCAGQSDLQDVLPTDSQDGAPSPPATIDTIRHVVILPESASSEPWPCHFHLCSTV